MAAPFLGFVPQPTRGMNPLGFLVPAFEGLLQGQELGRERQDLQHLGNLQSLAASGQEVDFTSGFQSQQFRGQAAQSAFQNQALRTQPITPGQQQGFDIQREGIQQRSDAATASANRAARGTPYTLKYFDDQGQEQGVRVDNTTDALARQRITQSGGTFSDPIERENSQSVLDARRKDQERAAGREQRDIAGVGRSVEDRDARIAQDKIDEQRAKQAEERAIAAEGRAETGQGRLDARIKRCEG